MIKPLIHLNVSRPLAAVILICAGLILTLKPGATAAPAAVEPARRQSGPSPADSGSGPASLVKDIRTSGSSGVDFSPTDIINLQGIAFFSGSDHTHGTEIWRSDGTEPGTTLVQDICPGVCDANPQELTSLNGVVFFAASETLHGNELWSSDGSAAGTGQFQDIAAGAASSSPAGLTAAGSTVFFIADDGSTGFELWAIPPGSLISSNVIYLPVTQRNR